MQQNRKEFEKNRNYPREFENNANELNRMRNNTQRILKNTKESEKS